MVIKPSELSPAVSGVIAKYIPQYFEPDVCRVVVGGIPETTKVRFISVRSSPGSDRDVLS